MALRARSYSRAEQLADQALHGVALIAALLGGGLLIALAVPRGDATLAGSVTVYSLALVALFLVSALCNHILAHRHSRRAAWLRRLDPATIFFMIAATYTPFAAEALGPPHGWALLAYIWSVALLGIGAKLLLPHPPGRIFAVALSLLLGWSVLVVLKPLSASIPPAGIAFLVAGGVLYTTGVPIYLWDRLPFHLVAWHGFVVAAATCHYAAILASVVLPPTS